LNLTGGTVTVIEDDASDLAGLNVSTLSLTSAGEVTDSGNLTVSGVATVANASGDLTLDSSGNSFGSVALSGTEDVAVVTSGALSGMISGDTLQVQAATGIGKTNEDGTIESLETTVTKLAATTTTGNLAVTNTGGLTIEDFSKASTISDPVKGPQLSGVSITAGSTSDAVKLVAMSPITVNAPVTNSAGAVTLAATGSTAEDVIVVNSTVSTAGTNTDATIDLFAGGSITLSSTAALSSSTSANLQFSTNYDSVTGETSQGYTGATITIATSSIDGGLSVAGYGGLGLDVDSKARIQTTTQDQVADYFNALDPLLESLEQWDAADASALQASVGLGAITLDTGESANVEVEEEEEK
jgi:hypothetical protein